MWGYIAILGLMEHIQCVPSLYVRVYRKKTLCSSAEESSLTVCEGISPGRTDLCANFQFPHCMWGYIGQVLRRFPFIIVPSLYVRVYRLFFFPVQLRNRSLTVCEGISLITFIYFFFFLFPHCMWGYIAPASHFLIKQAVPSLYVRVYRMASPYLIIWSRSLTVCEGISARFGRFMTTFRFPHCMWGYIVLLWFSLSFPPVPSLYVRVYRPCICTKYKAGGSLTVCEGISMIAEYDAKQTEFPHCMWGYIDCQSVPRIFACVPSLYVRVYRPVCNSPGNTQGSLTVCECISSELFTIPTWTVFPHCMWGYITDWHCGNSACYVPSLYLYVRVYLNTTNRRRITGSSLTVYEGISARQKQREASRSFPHCMWGYIVGGIALRRVISVPSLYVRVYRAWNDRCGHGPCSLTASEGISLIVLHKHTLEKFPHCKWEYIGLTGLGAKCDKVSSQ